MVLSRTSSSRSRVLLATSASEAAFCSDAAAAAAAFFSAAAAAAACFTQWAVTLVFTAASCESTDFFELFYRFTLLNESSDSAEQCTASERLKLFQAYPSTSRSVP